jgi:hypothetical protein
MYSSYSFFFENTVQTGSLHCAELLLERVWEYPRIIEILEEKILELSRNEIFGKALGTHRKMFLSRV